jgi:hypothetical protein
MNKVVKIDPITKPEFELWVESEITDSQWEAIADEIEGRANNFIDELLANIMKDYREGLFDDKETDNGE